MHGNVIPGTISGQVSAPASKSAMQRAVAMAVRAGGESFIRNPSDCADAISALGMARGLGADIALHSGAVSISGNRFCGETSLEAGESGLGLRMFTAVAACYRGPVTLEASGSLTTRPAGLMVDGLAMLEVPCRTANGYPPVTVGGPLKPGRVDVDGSVTSQFLTGLLIALSSVEGESEIHVHNLTSRPYVRMTVDMLEAFGADVVWEPDDVFRINGRNMLVPADITVEGDWSSAASLLCAGAVGGEVTVTGLSMDSLQADRAILHALDQIGADVAMGNDGSVTARRTALRPFTFDVTHCPDLVPVLTAVALCGAGESRFTGTGRLKFKESHRPKVLAEQFGRLGGRIRVEEDHMIVTGGRLSGGDVDACGDHRIAMALAIGGLNAAGPVTIHGADCVSKSYPDFFLDLAELRRRDPENQDRTGDPS